MKRRGIVRFGALVLTLAVSTVAGAESSFDGKAGEPTPNPGATPALKKAHDAATGADEVGIGRSVGAVKSSGDEGGTAAGMPGKAPGSPK